MVSSTDTIRCTRPHYVKNRAFLPQTFATAVANVCVQTGIFLLREIIPYGHTMHSRWLCGNWGPNGRSSGNPYRQAEW